MTKFPVKPDPADFAARLQQAFDRAGVPSRGRGAALRRRHKVSGPTASNWLGGKHLPEVERVWVMARDLGVSFGWLYFGEGPMVDERPAAGEIQPDTILYAFRLLDAQLRRHGLTFDMEADAVILCRIYQLAARNGGSLAPDDLVELGRLLAPRTDRGSDGANVGGNRKAVP